jgi:hypothetical protein
MIEFPCETQRMALVRCLLVLALLVKGEGVLGATALQEEKCEPSAERNAVAIMGRAADGRLSAAVPAEIHGDHDFVQRVARSWHFHLNRSEYGWVIALIHRDGKSGQVDLTGITPPYSGVPNPREIHGWHFRNRDNSGPNRGDVNAPQHLRRFVFSRSLIGTGGFKPSTDPETPRYVEPDPSDGRGWLRIVDYGLSDLEPDQRARMTYLKFTACLTWPRIIS